MKVAVAAHLESLSTNEGLQSDGMGIIIIDQTLLRPMMNGLVINSRPSILGQRVELLCLDISTSLNATFIWTLRSKQIPTITAFRDILKPYSWTGQSIPKCTFFKNHTEVNKAYSWLQGPFLTRMKMPRFGHVLVSGECDSQRLRENGRFEVSTRERVVVEILSRCARRRETGMVKHQDGRKNHKTSRSFQIYLTDH